MIRIGLIRERKSPADTSVAVIPEQCVQIMQKHPGLKIVVEPSPDRCIPDAYYAAAGRELKHDLSDCDVLLGIKEVRVDDLIPCLLYTYCTNSASHLIYNQTLLFHLMLFATRNSM